MRDASIRVAYTNSANGWDKSKEDRWTKENDRYSDMLKSGIEPEGTTNAQMDKTMRKHEKAHALSTAVAKGDFDVN